jgi:hypothetical protein
MFVLFQTTIYKTLHRKLSNTKPIKTGGELTCSVMVGCSYTCCVNLVTNPMIRHEEEKDRIVITTKGTLFYNLIYKIYFFRTKNILWDTISSYEWMQEMIARFVVIGGIIDHLCLNFIHNICEWVRIVWKYQREVIRIHISKKRQHNGQRKKYKRTNNDLQNIHIKLKTE